MSIARCETPPPPPPHARSHTRAHAHTHALLRAHAAARQDTKNFEFDEWNGVASTPYLATFLPEADAEAVTRAYLARAVEEAEREAAANAPVLDEGEELCNCEFSLAYGAKILLNNATMRLLRGHRYGLCGPNGVGKVRAACAARAWACCCGGGARGARFFFQRARAPAAAAPVDAR
jgi:hypothetical protein